MRGGNSLEKVSVDRKRLCDNGLAEWAHGNGWLFFF